MGGHEELEPVLGDGWGSRPSDGVPRRRRRWGDGAHGPGLQPRLIPALPGPGAWLLAGGGAAGQVWLRKPGPGTSRQGLGSGRGELGARRGRGGGLTEGPEGQQRGDGRHQDEPVDHLDILLRERVHLEVFQHLGQRPGPEGPVSPRAWPSPAFSASPAALKPRPGRPRPHRPRPQSPASTHKPRPGMPRPHRPCPQSPAQALTWCSSSSISISARRRPRHCRGPKPKARWGSLAPEPRCSQRWGW